MNPNNTQETNRQTNLHLNLQNAHQYQNPNINFQEISNSNNSHFINISQAPHPPHLNHHHLSTNLTSSASSQQQAHHSNNKYYNKQNIDVQNINNLNSNFNNLNSSSNLITESNTNISKTRNNQIDSLSNIQPTIHQKILNNLESSTGNVVDTESFAGENFEDISIEQPGTPQSSNQKLIPEPKTHQQNIKNTRTHEVIEKTHLHNEDSLEENVSSQTTDSSTSNSNSRIGQILSFKCKDQYSGLTNFTNRANFIHSPIADLIENPFRHHHYENIPNSEALNPQDIEKLNPNFHYAPNINSKYYHKSTSTQQLNHTNTSTTISNRSTVNNHNQNNNNFISPPTSNSHNHSNNVDLANQAYNSTKSTSVAQPSTCIRNPNYLGTNKTHSRLTQVNHTQAFNTLPEIYNKQDSSNSGFLTSPFTGSSNPTSVETVISRGWEKTI